MGSMRMERTEKIISEFKTEYHLPNLDTERK